MKTRLTALLVGFSLAHTAAPSMAAGNTIVIKQTGDRQIAIIMEHGGRGGGPNSGSGEFARIIQPGNHAISTINPH